MALRAFTIAIVVVAALSLAAPCDAAPFEGFGAATSGGSGGTVVHVTNLNDAGPGSLREAVKQARRTIVFDVAGEIVLGDPIIIGSAFVTIDGFTAPSPGITLRNAGLSIRGTRGAHDVVVRGLRVRSASIDGIQVWGNAYNVVIDHVSVDGSGDGNIDITEGSRDVTVSWSILSGTGKNMLIKYVASRVTLHHNIFIGNTTRNPQARVDDNGGEASELTLDMRHNLVWDWTGGYGTLIWEGAWANVSGNYYGSSKKAIQVESARAWVQGNASADGAEINRVGTESAAFDAPAVSPATACAAARLALADAGVRPLDQIDRYWLARIDLGRCPDAVPVPVLHASPVELTFTASAGATAATQVVRIINDGGPTASWTARVQGSPGWLRVTPSSGAMPGVLTVAVNAAGLGSGDHDGALVIEAPGASSLTVPVQLTVAGGISGNPPPAGGSSTPTPAGGSASGDVQRLELAVASGSDDAREDDEGNVRLDTQLFQPGVGSFIAFRFTGVPIPRGATIVSATLWTYTLLEGRRHISVRYSGEDADDSAPFSRARQHLSSRSRTQAFVDDVPGEWRIGDYNPSPDLAPIVQEIVDRAGWGPGHGVTLFMGDNGSRSRRRMAAFESQVAPGRAALLTIEWSR